MAPGKHEDCEKCEEHMAWEERLKVLENVPTLMTFMNQELGSKKTTKILLSLFIGIPFLLLLALISKTQSDITEVKSATYQQIQSINQNTARISQDVAVMATTFQLFQTQVTRDYETIRREASQQDVKKYYGKGRE